MVSETSSNSSQCQSLSTQSRLGLPTNVGYYESTGGSTILRTKTPMYLIRPVNSSDSVMALRNGKGLRLKSLSEESDDSSIHTSTTNRSSDESTLQRLEKIKKKNEKSRDQRVLVFYFVVLLLLTFYSFSLVDHNKIRVRVWIIG